MSNVYQSHLTIVIGNPNKEMQAIISQQAKQEGSMEEDLWFDYVLRKFDAGTDQNTPSHMSPIDEMLSIMLDDDIRIAKPFNGFTRKDGRIYPVIIFYEDFIQDLEGNPISLMKISERMIELIREYFQRVVKADWITVTSTINTSPYF